MRPIKKWSTECDKVSTKFLETFASLKDVAWSRFEDGFKTGRYGTTDVGCYHMCDNERDRFGLRFTEAVYDLAMKGGDVSNIYARVFQAGYVCGQLQKEKEADA